MPSYLRFGLIAGAAYIAVQLIGFFSGLEFNPAYGWVTSLVGLGMIIYSVYAIRQQDHGGYITFSKAFSEGFKVGIVSGIVSIIFSIIYVAFIHPTFISEMMAKQMEAMEAKGMTQDQIEQAMAMAEKFTSPVARILFGVVATALFGAIYALIAAAIFQKKRPAEPIPATA